jgi:vitamin B12 transporter
LNRARCVRYAFPLSVLAAAAVQAQTVVITGTREPLAPERLAADVAVIDAETIRSSTADSLADLLRREAGVQVSRSGGPGQSTGIFLRGASSQQSLVLVDGVRVGSATLGSTALETLGLSQVERIEILRGPGSSLYGADAVGGVVNVITRSGAPGLQFDGRVAAGGYGSREASGGLRGTSGLWDYAATLASETSAGVSALRPSANTPFFAPYDPDRDGYRLDTAQLRLGVKPAAGHRIGLLALRTHLNSQYDAVEYAPPTFDPNAAVDFRTRQDTTVTALDWRGAYGPALVGSARVSHSEDKSSNGAHVVDRFRTTRLAYSAQLAWRSGPLGQLVGAAEHETLRGHSSSYGADVERRNDALVLELTGAAGVWSWQADVRRDDSSDFGAVNTGRIGGGVELLPGLRLRALVGNTFRAPSFNDLYFPGYGVATLRPERGHSIELGLSWRAAGSEASATVYRNRVSDLIGYERDSSRCPPDPAYGFGCAANVSRAVLQGATLAAVQRLGAWALRAQLDVLAAHDQITGARLPRRAAHQASLGADWTQADWTLGASVLDIGARPDGGQVLAAETTLDLSAVWRFAPAWQVQAKLLNATDRDIRPALGYQGLGRQGWLVLRYEPRL